MNKILLTKIKEAVFAVAPITVIVTALNFIFTPMPTNNFLSFLFGAFLLVIGMGLYSLGSDTAMGAMGSHIGKGLTRVKKLPVILVLCFVIGFIVTVAEPNLAVLASQVNSAIPSFVLLVTVALGVGIFLLLSVLRIFLKINLNTMLIIFYAILFAFAIFVNDNFVPLAFDSGGVATGPVTVPFIMALGIGLSANLGGKNSQDNSFGMIAICSIGPILMVVILGLFYNPEISAEAVRPEQLAVYASFSEAAKGYLVAFPKYLKDVGLSLLPIAAFFILFQLFTEKVTKRQLLKIAVGIIYTYIGLSVFLTCVNVGFMPAGAYIGKVIGSLTYNWILIPIGMLVGACIVFAEPAVHVLNKQVEQITSGSIKRSVMLASLSLAIAFSVGLSMLRILTGLSIWWILVPGYSIALILSFFVPKIFTGIAFDSGGVASGPMTTTFLLPLALGACACLNGNPFTDAFGVVAMVVVTPLIAIQILGLTYKIKLGKAKRLSEEILRQIEAEGDDIIELNFTKNKSVGRRSK